jgi:TolB-like protein
VVPLEAVSGDVLERRLATGLAEAIITDLAKLSGVRVLAHASMLELGEQLLTVDAMRGELGVTHILRGSLEREREAIRVNVQLIATSDKSTVWASRLDSEVKTLLDLEDEVSTRVAQALQVEIGPSDRRRLAHRHASDLEALALYRQGLRLVIPANDMTRVLAARRMFERVTEMDPGFAGGYAGQSFSHTVTVLFLNASSPESSLESGIALARMAIGTDPNFGMGYATLAFGQAMAGDVEHGLTNARKAVDLAPGDAFAQFMLGVNLVLSRQPGLALEPLGLALRLDPIEIRTPYLNVLAIARFATGDHAAALDALERNLQRGGPSGPHMEVFRAAALAELGRHPGARAIVEAVNQSDAGFRATKWLSRWLGPGDVLEQVIANLERLGLSDESRKRQADTSRTP